MLYRRIDLCLDISSHSSAGARAWARRRLPDGCSDAWVQVESLPALLSSQRRHQRNLTHQAALLNSHWGKRPPSCYEAWVRCRFFCTSEAGFACACAKSSWTSDSGPAYDRCASLAWCAGATDRTPTDRQRTEHAGSRQSRPARGGPVSSDGCGGAASGRRRSAPLGSGQPAARWPSRQHHHDATPIPTCGKAKHDGRTAPGFQDCVTLHRMSRRVEGALRPNRAIAPASRCATAAIAGHACLSRLRVNDRSMELLPM